MQKSETCKITGCDKPRHKNKARCLMHTREYERERKRLSNDRKRAELPPRKVVVGFPDLLVVERKDGDGLGNIILYQATKIIRPDEAKRLYGDSTQLARRDNCIILRAKIKVKGK